MKLSGVVDCSVRRWANCPHPPFPHIHTHARHIPTHVHVNDVPALPTAINPTTLIRPRPTSGLNPSNAPLIPDRRTSPSIVIPPTTAAATVALTSNNARPSAATIGCFWPVWQRRPLRCLVPSNYVDVYLYTTDDVRLITRATRVTIPWLDGLNGYYFHASPPLPLVIPYKRYLWISSVVNVSPSFREIVIVEVELGPYGVCVCVGSRRLKF